MKILKTVDFVGQTLILSIYVLGSAVVVIKEHSWSSLGMTTAYAMFCLGWWQMISASIGLLLRSSLIKQRSIHFISAIVYLLIIALVPLHRYNEYWDSFALFVAISIPIFLGIFYYCITWKCLFSKTTSGKFLPHISF